MIKGKRLTNSLSLGVAINIFAFALLKSFNILMAPILTSVLDTSDFGVISIYNTWVSIVTVIVSLGTVGSLTNFRIKSSYEEYHDYCWTVFRFVLLCHIIFLITFLIFNDNIANYIDLPIELIPLMVASSMCSFSSSFLSTYFIIENKALQNLILSLFVSVMSFLIFIFLISFTYNKINLFYLYIIAHLIVGLFVIAFCAIFFAFRGKLKIKLDYIVYSLGIGAPLVFHSLSGIILGSSDRIMVQKIDGLSLAGVYSFTYSFASILSSIWQSINSIWTPFLFRFLNTNDNCNMIYKKNNFDFLYTALSIGFVLVYKEIFMLLANQRYWEQIRIVPILVVAFYFNHLYSFPANFEMYKEKTIFVAIGSLLAAIINILLNLVLIPTIHEVGAAIATAISYFFLYVFHLFIAKRIIGNYPFQNVININYILCFSLFVFLAYCLYDFYIPRWIFAFCTGAILLKKIIINKALI